MFTELQISLPDGRVGYLQPGRIEITDGVISHYEHMSVIYRNGTNIRNSSITPLILDEDGNPVILEGFFVPRLAPPPKTKEEYYQELLEMGVPEEPARKLAEAHDEH